jgi:hypothetical protein
VQCLQLSNYYGTPGDGSALELFDCAYGEWNIWSIKPGSNPQIQLTGTNLCLDGGLDYNSGGTGVGHVYTCKEGLAQQQYACALFLSIQSLTLDIQVVLYRYISHGP